MTFKKEIITANKDKVFVWVDVYSVYGTTNYDVNISVIPKGKRKEVFPLGSVRDSWPYRSMDFKSQERQDYLIQAISEWITKEQLDDVVKEAWLALSPEVIGYRIREQ